MKNKRPTVKSLQADIAELQNRLAISELALFCFIAGHTEAIKANAKKKSKSAA